MVVDVTGNAGPPRAVAAAGGGAWRPHLAGLRLVIDPGHGGFDTGRSTPEGRTEADWTLDVGMRLAAICAGAGATVALTRSGDCFVPRVIRRAYAGESGAHIVLGLHLGAPHGHSAAAVLFGRAWWQGRRAERLARVLFEALDRKMPLHLLRLAGRRVAGCAVHGGRWRTLALLIVAHPAVDGTGRSPAAWAEALAEGLAAFHEALPRGMAEPRAVAGPPGAAERTAGAPAAAPPMDGPGPVLEAPLAPATLATPQPPVEGKPAAHAGGNPAAAEAGPAPAVEPRPAPATVDAGPAPSGQAPPPLAGGNPAAAEATPAPAPEPRPVPGTVDAGPAPSGQPPPPLADGNPAAAEATPAPAAEPGPVPGTVAAAPAPSGEAPPPLAGGNPAAAEAGPAPAAVSRPAPGTGEGGPAAPAPAPAALAGEQRGAVEAGPAPAVERRPAPPTVAEATPAAEAEPAPAVRAAAPVDVMEGLLGDLDAAVAPQVERDVLGRIRRPRPSAAANPPAPPGAEAPPRRL